MKSEFEQISSHKKTDSAVGKSTGGWRGGKRTKMAVRNKDS